MGELKMTLDNIRKILLGKEKDYDDIKSLKITEGALKKAQTYAVNIKRVLGKDIECYGYLITPNEFTDGVVRDIFLASQEADSMQVKLDIDDVIRAGKELKAKGFKILGWWHSHNTMSTFHSGTDDENLFTILNEIAPINFVEVKNEKEMFTKNAKTQITKEGLKIIDNEKDIEFIMKYDGTIGNKTRMVSSTLKAPIKVGYAYSMVVNSTGQTPHTEVAIKEFCPLYLREKDEEKLKVPLEIIKTKEKIRINENEIQKEIKKKVKEISFFGWSSKYSENIPTPRELEHGQKVYTKEEVAILLNKQKDELVQQYGVVIQKILRALGIPIVASIKWIRGLIKKDNTYPNLIPKRTKIKMKDIIKRR